MADKSENSTNKDFQQLFADVKEYVQLQSDYLQVTAIEKVTKLMSKLIFVLALMVLGLFGLFYLLFAVAYALEPIMHFKYSFSLIALFFLILMLVVIINRKRLFVKPLMRLMIDVLYDKPEEKKEVNNENNATSL